MPIICLMVRENHKMVREMSGKSQGILWGLMAGHPEVTWGQIWGQVTCQVTWLKIGDRKRAQVTRQSHLHDPTHMCLDLNHMMDDTYYSHCEWWIPATCIRSISDKNIMVQWWNNPAHEMQLGRVMEVTSVLLPGLYIFIQENACENVVWKMAAILSRPQCVKLDHSLTPLAIANGAKSDNKTDTPNDLTHLHSDSCFNVFRNVPSRPSTS